MVESALSPPYDGSEFEELLFPELGEVEVENGYECDDMVDIESLVDSPLPLDMIRTSRANKGKVMSSSASSSVESMCSALSDSASGSANLQAMDFVDRSRLQSIHSDSLLSAVDVEEENETDWPELAESRDDSLRYLIAETNPSGSGENITSSGRRKRRLPSHDLQDTSPKSYPPPNIQKRKVKAPKTAITLVCEDGIEKTLQGPNRNAVMAKLNRERKKQHMSDLETKVGLLGTENDALKKQNKCMRKKLVLMERELQYVKGVLANQSALAGLLKNIRGTGLEFHSSMNVAPPTRQLSENNASKKRRMDDHDYCLDSHHPESDHCSKKEKRLGDIPNEINAASNISNAAGVCLHVSDGSVSLEFCSKCSAKAKAAQAMSRMQRKR